MIFIIDLEVLYLGRYNENYLPRPLVKVIKQNKFYMMRMTSDNPPAVGHGSWGVQQDYLIPLNAGQEYRFEMSVGWISAK